MHCLNIPAKIRGLQTSSVKDKSVNISGLAGHTVSVTTIQLCHSRAKAARQFVNKWAWLCSNKNLFIKTGDQVRVYQLGSRPNFGFTGNIGTWEKGKST